MVLGLLQLHVCVQVNVLSTLHWLLKGNSSHTRDVRNLKTVKDVILYKYSRTSEASVRADVLNLICSDTNKTSYFILVWSDLSSAAPESLKAAFRSDRLRNSSTVSLKCARPGECTCHSGAAWQRRDERPSAPDNEAGQDVLSSGATRSFDSKEKPRLLSPCVGS